MIFYEIIDIVTFKWWYNFFFTHLLFYMASLSVSHSVSNKKWILYLVSFLEATTQWAGKYNPKQQHFNPSTISKRGAQSTNPKVSFTFKLTDAFIVQMANGYKSWNESNHSVPIQLKSGQNLGYT